MVRVAGHWPVVAPGALADMLSERAPEVSVQGLEAQRF